MTVCLRDPRTVDEVAIAPASDTPRRQPWTQPQLRRYDAAASEFNPGIGPDSGFSVS